LGFFVRRILAVYHGGGYSGCFWEINAFAFVENRFIDVYSSGRRGIRDNYVALEAVRTGRYDDEEVCLYNIDSVEEMDALSKDYSASFAIKVGLSLLEHEVEATFTCPECEDVVNAEYMVALETTQYGLGGIASACADWLCHDCYLSHTCDACGEWMESADDVDNMYGEPYYDDQGQYCMDCAHKRELVPPDKVKEFNLDPEPEVTEWTIHDSVSYDKVNSYGKKEHRHIQNAVKADHVEVRTEQTVEGDEGDPDTICKVFQKSPDSMRAIEKSLVSECGDGRISNLLFGKEITIVKQGNLFTES